MIQFGLSERRACRLVGLARFPSAERERGARGDSGLDAAFRQ
jgi:hypothetical protein